MSGKPAGSRPGAAAWACSAAVAVLTRVRRQSPSSGGSASAGSATDPAELAYAHRMQTHDVPGFPDPNPSGSFGISINGSPHANSPAARANDACEHLLPAGARGRQRRQRLAAPASPAGAAAADCPGSLPCYTPRQLRVAYGIQPLLDRGIDGRGVTVALPEEAESGPAGPSRSPPAGGHRHSRQDLRTSTPVRTAARIQVITALAAVRFAVVAGVEEVEDTAAGVRRRPDATTAEILEPMVCRATPGVRHAGRHGGGWYCFAACHVAGHLPEAGTPVRTSTWARVW